MYYTAIKQKVELMDSAGLHRTSVEDSLRTLSVVAGTLPEPLGFRLIEHYQDRIQRAKGRPMLGEQAVFLFSDLLNITRATANEFVIPWLLLYEHSLLLDDLLDRPSENYSYDLILSQALLDMANSAFQEIFGAEKVIWSSFERCRLESMIAMIHEIEWSKGIIKPKKKAIFSQQGHKAALAKFCATVLVFRERKVCLSPWQEKGVDDLCKGIQLLDDLDDLFEDLKENRTNFLLDSAIQWLNNCVGYDVFVKGADVPGPNQLLISLVLSGTLSKAWTIASNNIERSLKLINPSAESEFSHYFRLLAKECRHSSNILDESVSKHKEMWKSVKNEVQNGESAIMRVLNSRAASKTWKEIISLIDTGPKACN